MRAFHLDRKGLDQKNKEQICLQPGKKEKGSRERNRHAGDERNGKKKSEGKNE